MNLFGFERNIFEEGYHRSTKIPNLDKTKFLKIYSNLVDNKEDNMFLSNIFIKNDIGDQIIYENHNNYKRKKILENCYRIYCFNVSRNIRDDHNNKFINIITNMETTSCVVYIILKTHSSVKLTYSKSNGLVIYKTQ